MTAANTLIDRLVDVIINPVILLIFAGGFFLFVWGLVTFLWTLNEGGETKTGKNHMIWGIVGMLVMVSVYGIITLIDDTFELDIAYPDVNRINNVQAPANFFGK